MAAPAFTFEELKRVIRYDPETGVFTRLLNGAPHPRHGARNAGCIWFYKPGKPYRRIAVLGAETLGHRLAWFYMTGEWPPMVDHRNCGGLDNRWANLRAATKAQNATNTGPRADNTTGLKGVSFDRRRGKWFAQIKAAGRGKFLGYHATPAEAHAAYSAASVRYHGEHGRAR